MTTIPENQNHIGHLEEDAWEDKLPTLKELQGYDIWELRRNFFRGEFSKCARFKKHLKWGPGPAHDSLTFAERGAMVHALDCSQAGLNHCQNIYKKEGLDVKTIHASAEDIPSEDGQFDFTFNAGVLEHFEDDQLERVIDEMIRVTKPGGTILAFCPNKHYFYYQHHLRKIAADHRYEFERAFTAKEMQDRFEARGLTDVHVSGVHIHPAPNYYLPEWLPKYQLIEPFCRWCFKWLENYRGLNKFKSVMAQDFVVWAKKPTELGQTLSFEKFTGGGSAVVDHHNAA